MTPAVPAPATEPDERLVPLPAVAGAAVWRARLVPLAGDRAAAGPGTSDLARIAELPPAEGAALLARRVLLRRAVVASCGGDPAQVRLLAGPGPRRVVAPGGQVLFASTTSAGVHGLLVLSPRPVGVDLERLPGPADAREVAVALLPSRERAWVLAGDPQRLPQRLLAVWVRKEAVVKATGEGLARDLRSFVVDPELDDALVTGHLSPQRLRTWAVAVPGHVAALAVGPTSAP